LKEAVALLEERGISKAALARALGKGSRPGTINDWLREPDRTINEPADRFEEAVASLVSEAGPRRVLDPLSYVVGSLVGIEGDAQRILDRIRTVRDTIGLTPAAQLSYGDERPRALRVAEGTAAHHRPASGKKARKPAPKKRSAGAGPRN